MRYGIPCVLACAMTVSTFGQAPGDRPAANPRATRSVVLARNGVIATSQPLASAAGLRVLQNGGNAIDAAVTAAAVLAVVEPTMNGLGGDLFAIVYDAKTKTLKGLNASGRSPAAATLDEFRRRKMETIPYRGELSVSVPGVVDGWHQLLTRHGTIPLAKALEPAISYAREGFAISEIISYQWRDAAPVLAQDPLAAAVYLPGGKPPAAGDVFRNPQLAATLAQLAAGGRDAFYRGAIGQAIGDDMKRRNGLLTAADIAAHTSDWVEPISTTYRGHEVFELPPNTQGVTALQMLNLLEGYDVKSLGHNSAAYLHLLVEAKRLAFADRDAWIADPASMDKAVLARMLSKDYAAERRREIDQAAAAADYRPMTRPGVHDAAGRRAAAGARRHHLHDGRRPRRQRRVAHPVHLRELRLRHCRRRHRHRPAQPRQPVQHGHGAPRRARARQAAVPHAGAGDGAEGRPAVAVVRGHGRRHAAAGARAGPAEPDRLRDEHPGGGRGAAVPAFGRRAGARDGDLARGALRPQPRGHKIITTVNAFGGFQGILFDQAHGVMMGGSDPRKDGLAIGY